MCDRLRVTKLLEQCNGCVWNKDEHKTRCIENSGRDHCVT